MCIRDRIARDFHFDDQERDSKLGGHISVAFFLLGLPACLVIGALTDVVQRKKLLVWTIVLGQGPCLLTLLVTRYWELFVLRTLTGVAVGGALPLVFSLTGDLFPPTSRSYASSMVGLCMHLGSMCGQGAAGYLGPTYGWRLPFAVVALPGLLVAWTVAVFAREPKRGGAEGRGGERERGGERGGAVYAVAGPGSGSSQALSSPSTSTFGPSGASGGLGLSSTLSSSPPMNNDNLNPPWSTRKFARGAWRQGLESISSHYRLTHVQANPPYLVTYFTGHPPVIQHTYYGHAYFTCTSVNP